MDFSLGQFCPWQCFIPLSNQYLRLWSFLFYHLLTSFMLYLLAISARVNIFHCVAIYWYLWQYISSSHSIYFRCWQYQPNMLVLFVAFVYLQGSIGIFGYSFPFLPTDDQQVREQQWSVWSQQAASEILLSSLSEILVSSEILLSLGGFHLEVKYWFQVKYWFHPKPISSHVQTIGLNAKRASWADDDDDANPRTKHLSRYEHWAYWEITTIYKLLCHWWWWWWWWRWWWWWWGRLKWLQFINCSVTSWKKLSS